MDPRAAAIRLEHHRTLPRGRADRFMGYGALGVPFASGHVLAFRRFASSSIGPPFTSVWHRDTEGRWTFYLDVEPSRGCPRYFGPALHAVHSEDIEIEWSGTHSVAVHVPGADLHWTLRLSSDPLSLALGAVARLTPDPLWNAPGMLEAIGPAAGSLLGTGSLRLRGSAPGGQRYSLHPTRVWQVAASTATLDGLDLGIDVTATESATLGDFPLPRRGLFGVGSAVFARG